MLVFALIVPLVLLVLSGLSAAGAVIVSPWFWFAGGPLLALLLLAARDLVQRRHSILRNYPVLGHMRFLLEKIRPEIQQYFIERNYDGRPYDRDTRTVIYERAKGIHGDQAFGTEREVNDVGYEWVVHSACPEEPGKQQPRVRVGGPDCKHQWWTAPRVGPGRLPSNTKTTSERPSPTASSPSTMPSSERAYGTG